MIADEITHTSRRDRLCACCGRTINTGERYVRDQVPGGWLLAKKPMHIACYAARETSVSKTNLVSKEKHDGTN